MRQIVLARHGRPDWDFRTPIPGDGLTTWLQGERDAALDASSRPSVALAQLARDAACVVASPLRRSSESARLLVPTMAVAIEADVREAALPSAFRSRLRLPPMFWAGLARFAWFCGWSPGVESFQSARERATRAAGMLHALADRGEVVVMGHGLMNALIAAQLRRLGWRGPLWPSRRHWGFGIYHSHDVAV